MNKNVYLNKQQILKNCERIMNRNNAFSKLKKRLMRIFPESWIQANFYKRFKSGLYLENSYKQSEFLSPTEVKLEDKEPIICCEKMGVGSWSSSSLNKFSVEKFSKFIEIDENFVNEKCNKMLNDYMDNIETLKKRAKEIMSGGKE